MINNNQTALHAETTFFATVFSSVFCTAAVYSEKSVSTLQRPLHFTQK